MNILFVHNYPTHFVKTDLEMLRVKHVVEERYIRRADALSPNLITAVGRADLVFCWFASYHALLPVLLAKLYGKPSVTVIGGYDVANLPEIGYGHQRGGWRKLVSRTVMQHSSHLLTFSQYAWREAVNNASVDPTKLRLIYQGVELPMETVMKREPWVLTVGNVSHENLERKGLRVFVESAAQLPQAKFALVGRWLDDSIVHLKAIATPNVTFTNWVSDEELCSWFRRSHVYVQASQHEGFGMAVAEAMAYGCVPVVARVGALPEVVGDAGVYITPPVEAEALATGVRTVFQSPQLRWRARRQVERNFSLRLRREKLYQYIQEAYDAKYQVGAHAEVR